MIGKKNCCWLCDYLMHIENTETLAPHHIFGGGNRKMSEKYGLVVWLCNYHHTGSNDSVHRNHFNNLILKRAGQKYFEEHLGDRQDFKLIFMRNYL